MKNDNTLFKYASDFAQKLRWSNKAEAKAALKMLTDYSKDFGNSAEERALYRKVATIVRAWLKDYATDQRGRARNPVKKNPDKNVNHDWYVEGMVRAQRQADYGKLNSLKADLRKMGKAQSDAIMADFRAGYKAWYDAQRKGGVVVRGGVHARKNNPEIEIRELILWAENDSKLSNQFMSIMKNLSRKHKKGTYDNVLAAKLWKYWIDEAVKNYNREVLGGGYSLKQSVFSVQDRKDAAIEVEEQWRDDVRGGEYLTFSNPSRRKNSVGGVRSKKAPIKIYEIYTKHPTTGETGWEIEWVRSTDKEIKSYPNFDVIITTNDFPMSGDRTVIKDWFLRKNPKDKNPHDGKGKHILFIFDKTGPIKFVAKHGKAWQLLAQKTRAHEFPSVTAASNFAQSAQLKRGQKIGIMKASLPKSFAGNIVKISRGK